MSDIVSNAKSARESLAKGLNLLQANPNAPPGYLAAAEPIAKAMGELHRIELGGASELNPAADEALNAVRGALSILQGKVANDPQMMQTMEAVASSLGTVYSLKKLGDQVHQAQAQRSAAVPVGQPGFQPTMKSPPWPQPTEPAYQPSVQGPPRPGQPAQYATPYQPPVQGPPRQAPYEAPAQAGPAQHRQPYAPPPQQHYQPPQQQHYQPPQQPQQHYQPPQQQQQHYQPPPQPQQHYQPQPQPQQHYQPQPQPQQHYQPQPQPQPHYHPPQQPQQHYQPPQQAAQPAAGFPYQPSGFSGSGQAPGAPYQPPQPADPRRQPPPLPQQARAAAAEQPPAAGRGGWAENDPFAAPSAASPIQAPRAPVPPNHGGARASAEPYRGGELPAVEAELGTHSPTNFYKGLSGSDVVDHGGLFIATYKIPPVGQTLKVQVALPGSYEFEAVGVVRWTRDAHETASSDVSPPGFGIQFTHISSEARQLVYRYTRNREPLFHDDL